MRIERLQGLEHGHAMGVGRALQHLESAKARAAGLEQALVAGEVLRLQHAAGRLHGLRRAARRGAEVEGIAAALGNGAQHQGQFGVADPLAGGRRWPAR
jgi:hypothetical protein